MVKILGCQDQVNMKKYILKNAKIQGPTYWEMGREEPEHPHGPLEHGLDMARSVTLEAEVWVQSGSLWWTPWLQTDAMQTYAAKKLLIVIECC